MAALAYPHHAPSTRSECGRLEHRRMSEAISANNYQIIFGLPGTINPLHSLGYFGLNMLATSSPQECPPWRTNPTAVVRSIRSFVTALSCRQSQTDARTCNGDTEADVLPGV